MKILVDICHPAHVHFFKNAIMVWQKKGYDVKIVARDKDVTIDLLSSYNFDFESIQIDQKKIRSLIFEFIQHTVKLLKVSKSFKPDRFVSIGSPSAAWASFLTKKTHIAFDDTEHARFEHFLYRPFTEVVYTPKSYKEDFGRKQIKYEGFHELAYLHPKWFKPDFDSLRKIGLDKDEIFIVVRFVSWKAFHDRGQKGLSESQRFSLIETLKKYGKVIVTDEHNRMALINNTTFVPPENIHDLLYYSSLYIGEGGTMATEAAILGTPSIFISPLKGGNWDDLENKYQLLYSVGDEDEAIKLATEILSTQNIKEEHLRKKRLMLEDMNDVTELIVNSVESSQ